MPGSLKKSGPPILDVRGLCMGIWSGKTELVAVADVSFRAYSGQVVALKVLTPELAAIATARRRFEREAKAAAAVDNEHIVAIHRVGEIDGLPFLLMSYVAGGSLQK